MADPITESIFFLAGMLVIILAVPYILINASSYSSFFTGQATISQIVNQFHLNTPLIFGSQTVATITNFGNPTKILLNINAIGCSENSTTYFTFITGINNISLPAACSISTPQEYKLTFYGANNVEYMSYTIEKFTDGILQVSGFTPSTQILINKKAIVPVPQDNNVYVPLPSGSYNITTYNSYSLLNSQTSFSSTSSSIINFDIPRLSSTVSKSITVYQVINGVDDILSLAKVSINYNSTIQTTSSNGVATFPYMTNEAQLNISCPLNTCAGIGTSVSNNYTSISGTFNLSKTSKFYLYPLYETHVKIQLSCTTNSITTKSPTSGTINFINTKNSSLNKNLFINASGSGTLWLGSGNYNVSATSYSNLVATGTFNSIKENQALTLNFTAPSPC